MLSSISGLFGNSRLAALYQSVGTINGGTLTSHKMAGSVTITAVREGTGLCFVYISSDLPASLKLTSATEAGIWIDNAGMRQFSWSLSDPKFIGVKSVRQTSRHLCLEAAVLEQLFMTSPDIKLTVSGGQNEPVSFISSSAIKIEFTGNVDNQLHFKFSSRQSEDNVEHLLKSSSSSCQN